jgi:CubicO group peptidase (beta-lactamase class C family)
MLEAMVPGVSIALIRDARLFWRGVFGVADAASRRPVDDDTVFEAASVSKTVFAYAVMKLCEKGTLNLDTPLTRYTPERFLADDPRLDLITARHVLSHTAGFQDWRSRTEPLQIHFEPGQKWLYSGEGYEYLQSVVTRLSGRVDAKACGTYEAGLRVCATDIDTYMKRNLLVPFGMRSSGYVWNDVLAKHAARPHDERGRPLPKSKPTAIDAARYAAAGGLHTTPTDYAKFLIEVMNAGKGDAFRLGAQMRDEMIRPQVKADEGTSWALGWQIRHTDSGTVIQHGGDNTGFHAFAAASIEHRSGWVVMTNGDNGWRLFRNQALWDALNGFLDNARAPVIARASTPPPCESSPSSNQCRSR